MKALAFVMAGLLTLSFGVSYASDMALYVGLTKGWYDNATMLQDAQKIVNAVGGMLKETKTFNDDQLKELKAWTEANLDDGELDIIWLPGTIPSVLYPLDNVEPDESLAEEWLDNGNMLINLGDWFAYKTIETGEKQVNGRAGAENILDLPGIVESTNDLVIKKTPTGEKYLPNVEEKLISDRVIQLSSIRDPWEVAAVFGSPSGAEDDIQADPVVIYNTDTGGYMAFINQAKSANAIDRATATIEFIKNWVIEIIEVFPVEFMGKLAVTWGEIKR